MDHIASNAMGFKFETAILIVSVSRHLMTHGMRDGAMVKAAAGDPSRLRLEPFLA